MELTAEKSALSWVEQIIALAQPKNTEWLDGSEEQLERLKAVAAKKGKYVGGGSANVCQANNNDRYVDIDNTFAVADDAGLPEEYGITEGCMRGRTMYLVPFCLGAAGTDPAKYGVVLTDSIRLADAASAMPNVGAAAAGQLEKAADFIKIIGCTNGAGYCDLYSPHDNTVWMSNCSGSIESLTDRVKNAALGAASYSILQDGLVAENMLILAVTLPNGRAKYIAAVFSPKTGRASLTVDLPGIYKKSGYKLHILTDGIAWITEGKDGQIWAVNPEAKPWRTSDTKQNTVNMPLLNGAAKRNTFHLRFAGWEKIVGSSARVSPCEQGMSDGSIIPESSGKAASMTPYGACGVPLSAVIFVGGNSNSIPLVCQAKDCVQGVYICAAAMTGTIFRNSAPRDNRSSFAVLHSSFGYNIGGYLENWLNICRNAENKTKIFGMNCLLTDEYGEFVWPGFCDNFRLLEWILARCENEVNARASAVGYIPEVKDINVREINCRTADGKPFSAETLEKLLNVDTGCRLELLKNIKKAFSAVDGMPYEITEALEAEESCLRSGLN